MAQLCGAPFYEAVARLELARAHLAAPVPTGMQQARTELDEALAIADRLHMRAIAPQIHLGRADLATSLGDLAAAEAAMSTAHRLFVEVGAIGRAEQVAGAIKTDGEQSPASTQPRRPPRSGSASLRWSGHHE